MTIFCRKRVGFFYLIMIYCLSLRHRCQSWFAGVARQGAWHGYIGSMWLSRGETRGCDRKGLSWHVYFIKGTVGLLCLCRVYVKEL
jgi:hypothetical protein